MNHIIIKIAEPAILPQVKRFFRVNGFRPQAPRGDIIYLALLNNRPAAALRLTPFGNSWLLRSMCVDEKHRGQGIGTYMLDQIAPLLRQKRCYCFPYRHLESFYRNAGFVSVGTDQVPELIAEQYSRYRSQGRDLLLMACRS